MLTRFADLEIVQRKGTIDHLTVSLRNRSAYTAKKWVWFETSSVWGISNGKLLITSDWQRNTSSK